MQQWSKKWEGKIEKSAEVHSASTRTAWYGLLAEADANSKEHLRVEQKISGELQNKTTHWRKDNYQKALMTSKYGAFGPTIRPFNHIPYSYGVVSDHTCVLPCTYRYRKTLEIFF